MANTITVDQCIEIAVIIGKEAASMVPSNVPSKDITSFVGTALDDAKKRHNIPDYLIFMISRFIEVYLEGVNAGIEIITKNV